MIGQIINNKLLSCKSKLTFLLFLYIKKIILKFSDPIVKQNVYNYDLQMPMSHALPLILKNCNTYSTNLGRVITIAEMKYSLLTCIDIGANIGDSVAIIRNKSGVPILCVEGEPNFYNILVSNCNQFTNVYTCNCFVGDTTKGISSSINITNGTAHLSSISQSYNDSLNIKNLNDIVQEHETFRNAKFIKIDTDGYDLIILRGAQRFLYENKPILFIEYDPYFLQMQNEAVTDCTFDFLKDIGYDKMILWDNYGKYLLSGSIKDKVLIEDINSYISNRGGSFYIDMCILHEDDIDVFQMIRKEELDYFK